MVVAALSAFDFYSARLQQSAMQLASTRTTTMPVKPIAIVRITCVSVLVSSFRDVASDDLLYA